VSLLSPRLSSTSNRWHTSRSLSSDKISSAHRSSICDQREHFKHFNFSLATLGFFSAGIYSPTRFWSLEYKILKWRNLIKEINCLPFWQGTNRFTCKINLQHEQPLNFHDEGRQDVRQVITCQLLGSLFSSLTGSFDFDFHLSYTQNFSFTSGCPYLPDLRYVLSSPFAIGNRFTFGNWLQLTRDTFKHLRVGVLVAAVWLGRCGTASASTWNARSCTCPSSFF
jgi:hypothetical protein